MSRSSTHLNKVELVLQRLLRSVHVFKGKLCAIVRRPGAPMLSPGVRQGVGLGGDIAASRPHPTSSRNGTNQEREVQRPTLTVSASHYIDALDPDMRREIAREGDRPPGRSPVVSVGGAAGLATASTADHLERHYADLSHYGGRW